VVLEIGGPRAIGDLYVVIENAVEGKVAEGGTWGSVQGSINRANQ